MARVTKLTSTHMELMARISSGVRVKVNGAQKDAFLDRLYEVVVGSCVIKAEWSTLIGC